MKLNKKTIIIIACVVLVAYLIWRKSKKSDSSLVVAASNSDSGSSSTDPKNDLNSVIAVAFRGDPYNQVFAKRAKSVYQESLKNPGFKTLLQQAADEDGVTFIQECVINGAYAECFKQSGGSYVPIDTAHLNYYNTVRERILAM